MSKNIVETAREPGSLTTLLAAFDAAGLGDTLAVGGPYPVFAASDEAFAQLPEGTVELLLADPETSNGVIHIIDRVLLPAAADGISSTCRPALTNSAGRRRRRFD